MANFAELDDNNVVLRVIVISNTELLENGVEVESKGVEFCKMLYGPDTKWKQTSYNGNLRKNFAGIGYLYRADIDAFIEPQMFPSWTLNTQTAQWEPPIPMPIDGKPYTWNEATQAWDEVVQQAA